MTIGIKLNILSISVADTFEILVGLFITGSIYIPRLNIRSMNLLVPLGESYFSKSILKSPQIKIVLLSVTWLNRRSMLSQKTAKSDPGALHTQAITTCLLFASYKSIVTHTNGSVIVVDLLDMIEQCRESLTYTSTPPVCSSLQCDRIYNQIGETGKFDLFQPMFQR